MTGFASDAAVSSFEGKRVVLGDTEGHWREALDRVTRLAPAAVGTRSELPDMLILMAVGAGGRDGFTHRSSCQVATLASDPTVATPQRITSPIVIEVHLSDLLPSGGSVTTLAVASQAGVMGISVAVGAAGERDLSQLEKVRIALERLLHRPVASLALDLTVQAGERDTGCFVS